jgi:L-alanine-DL-glutamate epimerase-like enolase superfamily enzyme
MAVQAASVVKQLPYACELSEHQHLEDDPFESLSVENGHIAVLDLPGGGISYLQK